MGEQKTSKFIKSWDIYGPKYLLLLLLLVYSAYSIFIAINLDTGHMPDEGYRFKVSTYFRDTWGIPKDVPITLTTGEDLDRNPALGYWLFGRVLNIVDLIIPNASARQELVGLRIANWLFALGMVIFVYLISKELIENKWWQLLPVFLLTNTLMFVFLSGGVSYDNPTNLVCTAAIFFFIRVLKHKDFLTNSLAWMIGLSIGSLIKHTVLPLAGVMGLFWVIYIIRNKERIIFRDFANRKIIYGLVVVLLVLIGLNINLYGVNLVRFQSLRPSCYDTFSPEICDNSVFIKRHNDLALPKKLTVMEAFRQGYPDPVRFVYDIWIREMLNRIFGIMGAVVYFPIIITYYEISLYWIMLLGFRYIKKPSFEFLSLLSIFIFYALVLVYMNYNSELAYGFYKYIALQGRYIFPVISIAFSLCAFILTKVRNKYIRYGTLIALIALFLYGGPVRFLWYYGSVFADWFI